MNGIIIRDSTKFIVYNNKDFIIEKGYFNSNTTPWEITFKKEGNDYKMIYTELNFKESELESAKAIKKIIEEGFNTIFPSYSKDWTSPGEYTYKNGELIRKNIFK